MFTKTKMALAVLLVFGWASAALAQADNRANRVRGATPPAGVDRRNGAVNRAVKPFTPEEQGWFDRATRNKG
jgi:hypothetical protein